MAITFEQICLAHRAALHAVAAAADSLAEHGYALPGVDALLSSATGILIETAKQGALGEFAPVLDPETPITFGTVWRGQRLRELSVKELEWALDEHATKPRVPEHWRAAFVAELRRREEAA